MSSSPCLADAGASIQLETTVINPSSGGVFIPTFSTSGNSYDYTYTEPIPPTVTIPPIQQILPVVTPPKIVPPTTTPLSESITPIQSLPIKTNTAFPWNHILIALLGIVGITLLILGLRRRNET